MKTLRKVLVEVFGTLTVLSLIGVIATCDPEVSSNWVADALYYYGMAAIFAFLTYYMYCPNKINKYICAACVVVLAKLYSWTKSGSDFYRLYLVDRSYKSVFKAALKLHSQSNK